MLPVVGLVFLIVYFVLQIVIPTAQSGSLKPPKARPPTLPTNPSTVEILWHPSPAINTTHVHSLSIIIIFIIMCGACQLLRVLDDRRSTSAAWNWKKKKLYSFGVHRRLKRYFTESQRDHRFDCSVETQRMQRQATNASVRTECPSSLLMKISHNPDRTLHRGCSGHLVMPTPVYILADDAGMWWDWRWCSAETCISKQPPNCIYLSLLKMYLPFYFGLLIIVNNSQCNDLLQPQGGGAAATTLTTRISEI